MGRYAWPTSTMTLPATVREEVNTVARLGVAYGKQLIGKRACFILYGNAPAGCHSAAAGYDY